MKQLAVVILAAGEGTRMRSDLPKVLHPLYGRPLVSWVLSAVASLKPESVCLVVGHGAERVRGALKDEGKVTFVRQEQRLGSGHALLQAKKRLGRFRGDVLVLCGDTPLIDSGTLRSLVKTHRARKNAATVLSGVFDDPFGYGRIVRDQSGRVREIVEEKDASPVQRSLREINSGIYCFSSPLIWSVLGGITPENRKKEYYLTDAVSLLNGRGEKVGACSEVEADEILGVNTRADLAKAMRIVRGRTLRGLMLGGVTVVDPGNTYVSPEASIGADTVLHPGCVIEGRTVIGAGCGIGPFSFVRDSKIGDRAAIRYSHVDGAEVAADVAVGPYANLRPGAVLGEGARVGNFSEVKQSVIGRGSKVNHLSYIGDASLGDGVNVGAGTITCNYDGVRKHRTVVGDRVFIGSNVNLVAPVEIGPDVVLGAGSTITDDVPGGNLAIARARQVNKSRKKK